MLLLFLAFLMVNVAFLIVSLAAVYWEVTQRSPKEERCVISQKTAANETPFWTGQLVKIICSK